MRVRAIVVGVIPALFVLAAVAPAQVGIKLSPEFQSTTTLTGQEIQFPLWHNQIMVLRGEWAPGAEIGRHMHPVPVLTYVLEGTVTVTADGHSPVTYGPGQAFLDPVNIWHNAVNSGTTPAKTIVVVVGEQGKSFVIRP